MKRASSQIITLPDGTEIEPIRNEMALSRFPIHTLAKGEPVNILLQNQGKAVHWQVAPNRTFGAPGPLAYKIDTLVINRRIDEARSFGQAMPQILKLGSLHEIADEIGSESKTNDIKKALLQNASAFIIAKIEYTQKDKTRKFLEANFTRYQVVLTGEDLPGDRKADAVYIVLNPIFHEIVSSAQVRPVDYRYLLDLKPLSQRFYELVSPDIYGAVKNKNFTNIRYSDFCLLAPAVRQSEQWTMKKQLNPVIAPHLASGYLSKVHYQPIIDEQGLPDWFISLTPGALAYGQAEAFNQKRPRKVITAGDPRQPTLPMPMPPPSRGRQAETPPATADLPETVALIGALKGQGMNTSDAQRLARAMPDECRRQLEYLPFHDKPQKPGAFLRSAIEQGFGPPPAFETAQAQAEAERQRQDAAANRRTAKIAQEARRAAEVAQVDELLAQLETGDPDRFVAFSAYIAEERSRVTKPGMSESMKAKLLQLWETPEKRRELFQLWQAEQGGTARSYDPVDVERKHISTTAFQKINGECDNYNAARTSDQPELTAVGLLDEWVQHIKRANRKIAEVDKSYTDFALEKLYRDA